MSVISTSLTIPQKFALIANIEGLKKSFPVLKDSDTYEVKTSWNISLAIGSAILAALGAYLHKQAQLHSAIGCGFTAVLICTQIRTKIQIPTGAIEKQSKEIEQLFSDVIKELNDQWQFLSDTFSSRINEGNKSKIKKANSSVDDLRDKYLYGASFEGIDENDNERVANLRMLVPLAKKIVACNLEQYANERDLNANVYRDLVRVQMASQRFLYGKVTFDAGHHYVNNWIVNNAGFDKVESKPWPMMSSSNPPEESASAALKE